MDLAHLAAQKREMSMGAGATWAIRAAADVAWGGGGDAKLLRDPVSRPLKHILKGVPVARCTSVTRCECQHNGPEAGHRKHSHTQKARQQESTLKAGSETEIDPTAYGSSPCWRRAEHGRGCHLAGMQARAYLWPTPAICGVT